MFFLALIIGNKNLFSPQTTATAHTSLWIICILWNTQIFHTVEYDDVKIEENDLLQNIVYLFLLLAVSVVEALMDSIVFNTAV